MENACFNAGAWASSQTLGVESRSLHFTSSPAHSGTQSTAHGELLVRVEVFRQGRGLVKITDTQALLCLAVFFLMKYLNLGYTLKSPWGFKKVYMPRPHPRTIRTTSEGGEPRMSVFSRAL